TAYRREAFAAKPRPSPPGADFSSLPGLPLTENPPPCEPAHIAVIRGQPSCPSECAPGRLSMNHVLAEHGLCLTYLCDPHAIDELDQDNILDDLSDDTPNGDPLPWLTRCRLADYDHLVLVTDQPSGRYLGFLAATDGATPRDGFLFLETAF